MAKRLATLLMVLCIPALLFAQSGDIKGRVTDASTKEPLVGATVTIIGTTMGATTDPTGNYTIANVPAGSYTVRYAFVGYTPVQRRATIRGEAVTLNVSLDPTTIETGEVVVEVNRARDRETPVAFSNVQKMDIEQKIHGQDAPLLVQGTPGVYSYSTDGVGNGEAKVFVRGFSQNYVQVLINGVPTNDPESNAVYWSNWGAVSSNAASIQVQRGAGSSLYGAGSFGGSFNIVTGEAPVKPSYGLNVTLGDPLNSVYGIEANSGLINNKFAATLRIDRKVAEGSRVSGRYEGINYYGSLAWYVTPQQSLTFVLHGAPQVHGYSWSNPIAYFQRHGWNANPAPFLPRNVVEALPVDPNTGMTNYGLLDNSRELTDSRYVNLSHNFFHKPQAELHYRYDLNPVSSITATAFYSKGRGGGSSMNGTGTTFRVNSNGTLLDLTGPDGTIVDPAVARNVYLTAAYQRISYSFHQQGGILASFETKPLDMLRLTVGGEYRYWTADHPGHFTNLFGKSSINQSYARRDSTGKILTSTFSRRVYQGDLDGPASDIGNIFAWNMAGGNDPSYRSQYRNYRGETPQYTAFLQGNLLLDRLNIMGTLQYVWYSYKLIENMPSENAIGRMISRVQQASRGVLTEGPTGTGTFLMKDNSATNPLWYEFDLVNETRSRGFLQPKVGANFNVNDNLNVFANWAHVERFVDLGVYYNQGRVDPNVGDEKSDQVEAGIGWTSPQFRAKVNAYTMTWDNKSARITDISKAGEPGYDRNGNRNELVGTSRHQGIEAEITLPFEWLGAKGLEFTASATLMQNKWTKVLESVLKDPITGARRAFNTSSLDATGKVDTLFFDELTDTPVASGPQTMLFFGLNYRSEGFFTGLNVNYFARQYALDGGSYIAVDGGFYFDPVAGVQKFDSRYNAKLPKAAIVNYNIGTRFELLGLNATAAVQVLNLFDTQYLADADRSGVIPGLGRAFRFSLGAML